MKKSNLFTFTMALLAYTLMNNAATNALEGDGRCTEVRFSPRITYQRNLGPANPGETATHFFNRDSIIAKAIDKQYGDGKSPLTSSEAENFADETNKFNPKTNNYPQKCEDNILSIYRNGKVAIKPGASLSGSNPECPNRAPLETKILTFPMNSVNGPEEISMIKNPNGEYVFNDIKVDGEPSTLTGNNVLDYILAVTLPGFNPKTTNQTLENLISRKHNIFTPNQNNIFQGLRWTGKYGENVKEFVANQMNIEDPRFEKPKLVKMYVMQIIEGLKTASEHIFPNNSTTEITQTEIDQVRKNFKRKMTTGETNSFWFTPITSLIYTSRGYNNKINQEETEAEFTVAFKRSYQDVKTENFSPNSFIKAVNGSFTPLYKSFMDPQYSKGEWN